MKRGPQETHVDVAKIHFHFKDGITKNNVLKVKFNYEQNKSSCFNQTQTKTKIEGKIRNSKFFI